MLLIDYFERVATGCGKDRPFLHLVADDPASDVMLTYQEADFKCSQYARALIACGVMRGQCIAMLQPNSVEWVLWYFAAQKIGAITCALNTDFNLESLADIVRSAKAKAMVADSANVELALALKGECPLVGQVLAPDSADGADAISRFSNAHETAHLSRAKEIDPEDTTAIILSSGTTGNRPKAIQLSNRALIKGNGAYLSAVPVSSSGQGVDRHPHLSFVHFSVGNHGNGDERSDDRVGRAIQQFAVLGTGKSFRGVGSLDDGHDHSYSSKASARRNRVGRSLQNPHDFRSGDGQASPGCEISLAGYPLRRWIWIDGIGRNDRHRRFIRPPGPFRVRGPAGTGIDLRIVDLDTGKDAAIRQPGEILLRYGQGFSGYLDDDVAMRESVREGWFHTGDLAYWDEEGRVYFVDRIKDVIRCGGKNIAASEVEQAFASHPELSEVLALPAPDEIYGEQVAIVVVAKNPLRHFSIAEIQAYGQSRLAQFKIPKMVFNIAMEDLPRTPTGKFSKAALKRKFLAKEGA